VLRKRPLESSSNDQEGESIQRRSSTTNNSSERHYKPNLRCVAYPDCDMAYKTEFWRKGHEREKCEFATEEQRATAQKWYSEYNYAKRKKTQRGTATREVSSPSRLGSDSHPPSNSDALIEPREISGNSSELNLHHNNPQLATPTSNAGFPGHSVGQRWVAGDPGIYLHTYSPISGLHSTISDPPTPSYNTPMNPSFPTEYSSSSSFCQVSSGYATSSPTTGHTFHDSTINPSWHARQ
jgi:hypothetical protein